MALINFLRHAHEDQPVGAETEARIWGYRNGKSEDERRGAVAVAQSRIGFDAPSGADAACPEVVRISWLPTEFGPERR